MLDTITRAMIIMAGNYQIMLVTMLAIYTLVRIDQEMATRYHAVICSWLWTFQAVGIAAAWFAISRDTAVGPADFNPAMYEWRWLMKSYVAETYSWGMLGFIGFLLKKKLRWKLCWLAGLNVGAFAICCL